MSWGLITGFVFIACCCVHCYTDFKEKLLYDEVSLLMLLACIVQQFNRGALEDALWGLLAAGGAFFVLFLLCRGGMGLGDVKLAGVLGCWLGWERGLFCLLLSLWLGFGVAMLLMLFRLKTLKDAIPFGPYMCLAGTLMLFYGEEIMAWYRAFFNLA